MRRQSSTDVARPLHCARCRARSLAHQLSDPPGRKGRGYEPFLRGRARRGPAGAAPHTHIAVHTSTKRAEIVEKKKTMLKKMWKKKEAHLDQHRRVCEGVIEHGQHVGGGDDPGVVTPGGDQQPVVDLNRERIAETDSILEESERKVKSIKQGIN